MKPLIFEAFALSQSYTEAVEGKETRKERGKEKQTEGKHGKEQGKMEMDWLNNSRMRKEISMQ